MRLRDVCTQLQMEARSKLLVDELNKLQKLTTAVPEVWQALASRFNVDADTSGPPTPNLDAPKKKPQEAGGVAGFFGCADPAIARAALDMALQPPPFTCALSA